MKIALLVAALFSFAALAEEVDPASLYELKSSASAAKVKAGGKGSVTLEIALKQGAHVSEQAPMKIELTGKQVEPEKVKLTLADSVNKSKAGEFVNPKFEVPFAARAAGKGGVDAKMTFFICTEKICSRQQKTVSIPVEVE
jgi:hypothetical protein